VGIEVPHQRRRCLAVFETLEELVELPKLTRLVGAGGYLEIGGSADPDTYHQLHVTSDPRHQVQHIARYAGAERVGLSEAGVWAGASFLLEERVKR
jgi:hypothetical protein